jgi:integrase
MPQVLLETPSFGAAACLAPARAEAEQLRLFDFGLDLEVLRMARASMAERRRSPNTRKAYACDWRDFCRWCDAAGRSPLPASFDTLSLYLVSLARAGRLPSTIGRRVVGISAEHLAAGFASPASADLREVLAGIGRELGTAPRRAKVALSVEDLKRMLATCDDGPRGARDRALLLLGFASSLRRSELASLDLVDVGFHREGLVLRIGRSKTDQAGAGRLVGVQRGRRASTCPARALSAWIVERGDWAGPLFVPLSLVGDAILHYGKRLSGAAVCGVVQSAAKRAGLDPALYGGHSLRAGCATAAAASGASDVAIMSRTGHRSAAMMGRYVRPGRLFAMDPLAGVL